jgi:hypothetical protein
MSQVQAILARNAVPLAFAILGAFALALLPDLAWAQSEISSGANNAHREGVEIVRTVAKILVLAGFLLWLVGRMPWFGGVVMVVGVLGAIFSGPISARVFSV